MSQGAHNLTEAQRRANGAKGGTAEVPKGFATMEPKRRAEIARAGGLARQAKLRAARA